VSRREEIARGIHSEEPIVTFMNGSITPIAGASVPGFDRRGSPDRRLTWRGGRRDSDWMSRPPGALERLERCVPKLSVWRRWLSEAPRATR
jgi:hypothetical protein